jgi:hypothetical protein
MSKKRLVIIFVIILGYGTTFYLMGILDFIPKIRVSAKSPTGEYSVYVYEQRLFPRPIFPRMGAYVKIFDAQGDLVFYKMIYHDDDFDDTVGFSYQEIQFGADEIRISPVAYRPNESYIIKFSTLKK